MGGINDGGMCVVASVFGYSVLYGTSDKLCSLSMKEDDTSRSSTTQTKSYVCTDGRITDPSLVRVEGAPGCT